MLTAAPISEIISRQRQFFATGQTKEVNFRSEQLQKLKIINSNQFERLTRFLEDGEILKDVADYKT